MDDCTEHTCCGRQATSITITRDEGSLTLHTCIVCGQHVWRSAGRPVDRAGLLDVVRRPPRRRRRSARSPA